MWQVDGLNVLIGPYPEVALSTVKDGGLLASTAFDRPLTKDAALISLSLTVVWLPYCPVRRVYTWQLACIRTPGPVTLERCIHPTAPWAALEILEHGYAPVHSFSYPLLTQKPRMLGGPWLLFIVIPKHRRRPQDTAFCHYVYPPHCYLRCGYQVHFLFSLRQFLVPRRQPLLSPTCRAGPGLFVLLIDSLQLRPTTDTPYLSRVNSFLICVPACLVDSRLAQGLF